MEALLVMLFLGFICYGLCVIYKLDQLIKREWAEEQAEREQSLRTEAESICDQIEAFIEYRENQR